MEHATTSIGQDSGFEMQVPLEEDVGAELDYFVFLTLLGIDDEAEEFVSTVLSRHFRLFPVFAEISSYFVRQYNMTQMQLLMLFALNAGIETNDEDENSYWRCIEEIARDPGVVAQAWNKTAPSLISGFRDWTSEILVSHVPCSPLFSSSSEVKDVPRR